MDLGKCPNRSVWSGRQLEQHCGQSQPERERTQAQMLTMLHCARSRSNVWTVVDFLLEMT